MSTDAYLEQLGREHGFTLAELEANRQGALHPAQLARGTSKGRVAVIVLTILGIAALVGGLAGAQVFREELGPDPSSVDLNAVYAIGGVGTLLALVFFVCAATSLRRRRARKAAFAGGRIEVLDGPVNKIHVEGRGGMPSQFIFSVGGRSFHTSERLWELLTQGARYRLYCVADQLLSFAPASSESLRHRPPTA